MLTRGGGVKFAKILLTSYVNAPLLSSLNDTCNLINTNTSSRHKGYLSNFGEFDWTLKITYVYRASVKVVRAKGKGSAKSGHMGNVEGKCGLPQNVCMQYTFARPKGPSNCL